jgi:hypothetical protein
MSSKLPTSWPRSLSQGLLLNCRFFSSSLNQIVNKYLYIYNLLGNFIRKELFRPDVIDNNTLIFYASFMLSYASNLAKVIKTDISLEDLES